MDGDAGCRRESGLGVTSIASLSRALKGEAQFDAQRITRVDWGTYLILTFSEVPEVDARTSQRWARGGFHRRHIFDATGVRLRQMPFTPEQVRAAVL